MQDYVARNQDGILVVSGSRVRLASVVKNFLDGETPEAIQQSYPSLNLQSVYGAISFYLENRDDVDAEMSDRDQAVAGLREDARQANLDLRSRFLHAKVKSK